MDRDCVRRLPNAGEIALGGGEQFGALAAPLCGEIGIAAHHQTLAGELGCRDGGHVALVEQRQLQRAVCQQILDRRRALAVIQSRPAAVISSVMRVWVIMPRSPTSTTCSSWKRRFSLSTWAASVIGSAVLPSKTSMATDSRQEHRAGLDDLQRASPAVAAIAAFGQRTAMTFHVARRKS